MLMLTDATATGNQRRHRHLHWDIDLDAFAPSVFHNHPAAAGSETDATVTGCHNP